MPQTALISTGTMTTAENNLEICLIQPDQAIAANDFYNRVHGKSRSLEQWQWEFVENTYDTDQILYAIVKDRPDIIGTQAFIPVKMIDTNGTFWTAKSEETLVDPNYRGQKLFDKMYALLFSEAEKRGFAYVWGFTPAEKAFRKLNFELPGKTSQILFPLQYRALDKLMTKNKEGEPDSPASAFKNLSYKLGFRLSIPISGLKLSLKSRRKGDIMIRPIDSPPPSAGELCRKFIEKYGGLTIYRDSEYLQWRIFDNPYIKANMIGAFRNDLLLGWAAFSMGDDGMGYLVDILVASDSENDRDVINYLLREAVNGTRDMGALALRGWSVNNHPFDKLLLETAREIGFWHFGRGHSVVLYETVAGKNGNHRHAFDDFHITRIYTEGVMG